MSGMRAATEPGGLGALAVGRLYGVGVGPGDPGLMTLRAREVLERAPVLCYPKKGIRSDSYALSIIERVVPLNGKQLVGLVFPMTRDREVLAEAHAEIVAAIWEHLSAGRDCAFVTEGDPLLYSTFMHVVRLMREAHPEVEWVAVPGVSSTQAAVARLGWPLVDGDESLAILPATVDPARLREVLRTFEAVILLKVNRVMGEVVAALRETGRLEQAAWVKKVGAPDEEVVHDVASLDGQLVDYLSLVVVRR